MKADLITGFLGAGKTTFLKYYTRWLTARGLRVGILVNDHGAVNVDVLLLDELRSDRCEVEMVSAACGYDMHRLRFKTKLIRINRAMEHFSCDRRIRETEILAKDWDAFTDEDWERVLRSEYRGADHIKLSYGSRAPSFPRKEAGPR